MTRNRDSLRLFLRRENSAAIMHAPAANTRAIKLLFKEVSEYANLVQTRDG